VTVSKVNVTNGGFSGIDVGGNDAVVTDSNATNNEAFGIYFRAATTRYITRHRTIMVQELLFFVDNNTVSNSKENANIGDGIFFATNSNNVVDNSKADGDGGAGIDLTNGGGTVTDSAANGNRSNGIFAGGPGNLLTGNSANGNGSDGISVVCPSNLYDNTALGNFGGDIVTSGTGCARLGNKPAP
jgi:hypothetical protein